MKTTDVARTIRLAVGVILALAGSVCARPPPMAAGEREALLARLASGALDARGDAARRIGVLLSMNEIAADDAEALDGLQALLLAGHGNASNDAMFALGRMGMPALPAGIAAIQSDNDTAVSYGMQLLHRLAENYPDRQEDFSQAAELLGTYVRDENSRWRFLAIKALSAMGAPALPHLLWAFDHLPPDAEDGSGKLRPDLKYKTVKGLAKALSAVGEPAVAPLVQRLSSGEARVRLGAAYALGWMGQPAAGAVAPLIERLSDEEPRVQGIAAYALGRIGPAAKPAIARLIELAGEYPTNGAFLRALGEIGPDLAHLEDMIELMSVTTEERTALALCRAVAAIGPQATPRLSEALTDERVIVRKGAALALIFLGPDAKEAVPGLIEALEDEALESRAAQALGAIGPAAKDAAPALVKRLPYGQWPSLRAAFVFRYDCWPAMALGRIGPGAIPAVLDALKTDNLNQMAGCFVALKVMGRAARETAPAIIEAMGRADEPRVNGIGIEALLAIEADKDVVLAVVRPLAKDPRYKHNQPVHYALKQLESRE